MRKIIINADDFGLHISATKAICQAFAEGLITDTTIVANGDAFDEAVSAITEQGLQGKTGIHFNLTEGQPLTNKIKRLSMFTENGCFHGKINRKKALTKEEKKAVYDELTAQIEKVERAGICVTHADSHHHIHTGIFIAPIFARVCKEHRIQKVRSHRNIGEISLVKRIVKRSYNRWLRRKGFQTTTYFGSMEDVSCVGIQDDLEIMVHPEYDKNGVLIDKTDETDGYAVGEKLSLPVGQFVLKGYKDL